MTYYTAGSDNDGFGSRYQKIVQTYLYCEYHKLKYVYIPLHNVEHNYENDPNFDSKIDDLINLKTHMLTPDEIPGSNINIIHYNTVVQPWFEQNINSIINSSNMKFVKNCFWKNKTKTVKNQFKVAVHIRKYNQHDGVITVPARYTPNEYFIKVIDFIRCKYKEQNPQFHIYSQGSSDNFKCFISEDTQLHLNEDITETFVSLVDADILVTSASSFSYIAALLSDNVIVYKPFWHTPVDTWIQV